MKTSNNLLYIDREAVATLAMARDGLLKPVTKLMNKKESEEVNATGLYNGSIFPFSFILSPAGKREVSDRSLRARCGLDREVGS